MQKQKMPVGLWETENLDYHIISGLNKYFSNIYKDKNISYVSGLNKYELASNYVIYINDLKKIVKILGRVSIYI